MNELTNYYWWNYNITISDIEEQLKKYPNGLNSKDTDNIHPIIFAIYVNVSLDVIKYIITNSDTIETLDKTKSTPLLLAAYENDLDLLKYLIDYGADLTVVNKYDDNLFTIISDRDIKFSDIKDNIIKRFNLFSIKNKYKFLKFFNKSIQDNNLNMDLNL